jgi:hypothetical protein
VGETPVQRWGWVLLAVACSRRADGAVAHAVAAIM